MPSFIKNSSSGPKEGENVKNTDTRTDKQDDQKKLMWALRMTLTQNEKKSTDDNERPSIVSYRPLIVVFYFSLSKNVGQWHTFWVNGHWKFPKKNVTLWMRFSELQKYSK